MPCRVSLSPLVPVSYFLFSCLAAFVANMQRMPCPYKAWPRPAPAAAQATGTFYIVVANAPSPRRAHTPRDRLSPFNWKYISVYTYIYLLRLVSVNGDTCCILNGRAPQHCCTRKRERGGSKERRMQNAKGAWQHIPLTAKSAQSALPPVLRPPSPPSYSVCLCLCLCPTSCPGCSQHVLRPSFCALLSIKIIKMDGARLCLWKICLATFAAAAAGWLDLVLQQHVACCRCCKQMGCSWGNCINFAWGMIIMMIVLNDSAQGSKGINRLMSYSIRNVYKFVS